MTLYIHNAKSNNDEMVFRYRVTLGWLLNKIASRYTMFRIFLDDDVHRLAVEEVWTRLAAEFGEGFEEVYQECVERHELPVYSD